MVEQPDTATEQQPASVEAATLINGMTLVTALEGMADAKAQLSQRAAVQSLPVMSEQMQRLATYTVTVEEFLADLEARQELDEAIEYRKLREEKKSSNAAEQEARYSTAETKAEIKRLTRFVKSAWSLIDVIRSRFNHLEKEGKGQI